MNLILVNLIARIKQRVYIDTDEEIGILIEEYNKYFAHEKVKEAIKLSREWVLAKEGRSYTEQEILQKLGL